MARDLALFHVGRFEILIKEDAAGTGPQRDIALPETSEINKQFRLVIAVRHVGAVQSDLQFAGRSADAVGAGKSQPFQIFRRLDGIVEITSAVVGDDKSLEAFLRAVFKRVGAYIGNGFIKTLVGRLNIVDGSAFRSASAKNADAEIIDVDFVKHKVFRRVCHAVDNNVHESAGGIRDVEFNGSEILVAYTAYAELIVAAFKIESPAVAVTVERPDILTVSQHNAGHVVGGFYLKADPQNAGISENAWLRTHRDPDTGILAPSAFEFVNGKALRRNVRYVVSVLILVIFLETLQIVALGEEVALFITLEILAEKDSRLGFQVSRYGKQNEKQQKFFHGRANWLFII